MIFQVVDCCSPQIPLVNGAAKVDKGYSKRVAETTDVVKMLSKICFVRLILQFPSGVSHLVKMQLAQVSYYLSLYLFPGWVECSSVVSDQAGLCSG